MTGLTAVEAIAALRAAEAAEPDPPELCDWCRQAADTPEHRPVCRERLAWVIHPDAELYRDYWIVVGDFHKLHVTKVLGVMKRARHAERHLKYAPNDPDQVLVLVVKRSRTTFIGDDPGWSYDYVGDLNREGGYLFNTLAGARARALQVVAHYEETARIARHNVEQAPTVRRYPKTLTAKRLAENAVSESPTTIVDAVTAAP